MRTWLSVLRGLYVVVGVLPVLLYGGGWEWLEVPSAVLELRERLRRRGLNAD